MGDNYELVKAAQGPSHPKDKCDFCESPLTEENAIATIHVDRGYVTLCQNCYRKSGNQVR